MYRPARTKIVGFCRGEMRNSSRPGLATALIDPTFKLFFLLRFLCFMAVVYLALHWTVRRFSAQAEQQAAVVFLRRHCTADSAGQNMD